METAAGGCSGSDASLGGVQVMPCLPSEWDHAEVRLRIPGGGEIEIAIDDPEEGREGILEVEVDARVVVDGVVPLPDEGEKRSVIVRRETTLAGIGEAVTSPSGERSTTALAMLSTRVPGGDA